MPEAGRSNLDDLGFLVLSPQESLERKQKTDKQDAELLLRLLIEDRFPRLRFTFIEIAICLETSAEFVMYVKSCSQQLLSKMPADLTGTWHYYELFINSSECEAVSIASAATL